MSTLLVYVNSTSFSATMHPPVQENGRSRGCREASQGMENKPRNKKKKHRKMLYME